MGALGVRVKVGNVEIPYPIALLRGRLRMSGLGDTESSEIIAKSITDHKFLIDKTEANLVDAIGNLLNMYAPQIRENFQILTTFEQSRGITDSTPSFILILEGASATGKSMLAIELLRSLAATRFISSDTIRQVIRGIYDRNEHPEIHSHTYQAHKFKQSGDSSLNPIIRGYLAQSDLIMGHLRNLLERLLQEGVIAIIEGVHIQPGTFSNLGASVLEILIHPSDKTHRAMFLSKSSASKLKTVASDLSIREEEYNATRIIQDYLLLCATKKGVPVIEMDSYENAHLAISKLVIERMKQIMKIHV